MMDAGCYCAHALRFFPGCHLPLVVSAEAHDVLPGGVDTCMAAAVQYPGGSSISSSTSSSSSSSTSSSGGGSGKGLMGGGGSGSVDVLSGAVGRLRASLKWEGMMPTTHFTAVGSR